VPAPFAARPLRGGAVSPQATGVGGNTPGLSGYGAGANPPVAEQAAAPEQSAEANMIVLEANRLRHQQEIQAGRYPPLPRSALTDALQQESAAGATVTTPAPRPTLPIPPGGPQPFPAAQ
jgi:hypothetical protein